MMAVLFLIGKGTEDKGVIKKLLEQGKEGKECGLKYSMAADHPLVLSSCFIDNLRFPK